MALYPPFTSLSFEKHTAIETCGYTPSIANESLGMAEPPPSYEDEPGLPPCSAADPLAIVRINFAKYNLPQSSLSDDQTTATCTDFTLFNHPAAFVATLFEQASLPPKPLIRIQGVHSEWNGSYGPDEIDFDLTLNMMPLIASRKFESRPKISTRYAADAPLLDTKNAKGEDSRIAVVRAAQRFCDTAGLNTSFVLERKVSKWNTSFLEEAISALIASTQYVGTVTVSFPVTYSKVIFSRQRVEKSWFAKIFKKNPEPVFGIVESVWPHAIDLPNSQSAGVQTSAAQVEKAWWETWKTPIRNAVLSRKIGRITHEDWSEAAMGVRVPERTKRWGY